MNDLAEKGEKGYLALKIVEIIGEDEVNNLDPETIYFVTNLLNKMKAYILNVIGWMLLPFMDGIAKFLSNEIHFMQVVWGRYFFMFFGWGFPQAWLEIISFI